MITTELVLVAVTILATLAALFSAWFAHQQVKVAQQTNEAQNLIALINHLQREDVREARRIVLESLVEKSYQTWSDDDTNHASLVCASYDVAGILVRNGLVSQEIVVENYGRSIKECFKICRPLIEDYRGETSSALKTQYWNDFEWLYKKVEYIV